MILMPYQSEIQLTLLLCFVFAILWFRQLKTKNANAVDVAWSLSFTWTTLIGGYMAIQDGVSWRILLIGSLTMFWSLRLGIFLLINRVLKTKTEDGRYRRLRDEYHLGAKGVFFIYQAQVLLVLILSFPIWIAMDLDATSFRIWDLFGVLVFVLGMVAEAIADHQLEVFKSNRANQGHTCQVGLWKYSRHPNYFFEWIHWWAYCLFAIGSEHWIWTLTAPLVMLFFLLKLTGIPATEKQAMKSRSDYKAYQNRTSKFFPWPPKV